MNRHLSTIRYFFLVGVYGIAIGLLLLSTFVGVKCLNSENWIWSIKYLAWIFGFGMSSLITFGGALIVGAWWRRSNLIGRLDMQDEQYKLLVISIGNGILLFPSLLTGILTIGFSAGSFGLYILFPFMILLWLFSAVRFALGFRNDMKSVGLPLLVNSVFICLVVLLNLTNSRSEFGFRWRLGGYEEVVKLVEVGDLRPDDAGFATLPKDYQWLSDGREIIILRDENLTSIIFFMQLGFPGEYYAIAYRSDDSIPNNFREDRCDRGWRVQPEIPKWFVCVSTKL